MRFLGQNGVNHSEVESGENPCKHWRNSAWRNGAKGRFRITKPLLFLENKINVKPGGQPTMVVGHMGQVRFRGLGANKEIRQHGRVAFDRAIPAKGLSGAPCGREIQVNSFEALQSLINGLARPGARR